MDCPLFFGRLEGDVPFTIGSSSYSSHSFRYRFRSSPDCAPIPGEVVAFSLSSFGGSLQWKTIPTSRLVHQRNFLSFFILFPSIFGLPVGAFVVVNPGRRSFSSPIITSPAPLSSVVMFPFPLYDLGQGWKGFCFPRLLLQALLFLLGSVPLSPNPSPLPSAVLLGWPRPPFCFF